MEPYADDDVKRKKRILFKYDDLSKEFKEFEGKLPLYENLNSDSIDLFIDPNRKRVWIWHGSNTTTRMKFFAAKLAPTIREKYGIGYKITAVDEGKEPLGFKIMVGLEKESDYIEPQTLPTYDRTKEDLEFLESLTREYALRLLERAKERDNSSPITPPREESEYEQYCKFCGSKLSKVLKSCPVCGKMVI